MQYTNINNQFFLQGRYGDYVLYPAAEENIARFFEPCLDAVSADEIIEAWQLHHISVQDILQKVFSFVGQGIGEAYFLVCEGKGQPYVVGVGGIMPVMSEQGNLQGELWFLGEPLAKHKRFLVKHARQITDKALTRYSYLYNKAAAWNYQAFHLVRYLGFEVMEKAERTGSYNALFRSFYRLK